MRTSVSPGPALTRTCWVIDVTKSLSVEVKYAYCINPCMHTGALDQQATHKLLEGNGTWVSRAGEPAFFKTQKVRRGRRLSLHGKAFLGPVVQSWIRSNPGLRFFPVF
jgi:hypothetical protein